jgi:crotonobetainyl-CoA:carnitine CoA-transferase CaiB-like acyl-CoA transferase
VETSLFEALLFLNAGAIFHRPRHRPKVIRESRSPILRAYETSDGRAVQINLSGTERWRELCRLSSWTTRAISTFPSPPPWPG